MPRRIVPSVAIALGIILIVWQSVILISNHHELLSLPIWITLVPGGVLLLGGTVLAILWRDH